MGYRILIMFHVIDFYALRTRNIQLQYIRRIKILKNASRVEDFPKWARLRKPHKASYV